MREIAIDYIKYFVGHWYKWGGDDPSGFDCSGLVIEMLKSVGILDRGFDTTAEGLRRMFPAVNKPYRGCLVFYGDTRAVHVEICLNETLALGASGGGSKTKTVEDAVRHNAFIKMRPIKRNRNILGYVDPFNV